LKKFFLIVLIALISFSLYAQNNGKTSVAMLNYLATQARIISSSKENRLILEDIYDRLLNNSNPAVIDETTLDFFQILLEDIENFRIITYQRERLRFLFENQRAQAITKALPNPLYLLGARNMSPLALVATAATMAIDSAFKYQGAMNDAKLAYMQGDWDLDDRESAVLHNLRSRSFVYTVNITNQYRLDGSDTLNENSIDGFVDIALWDPSPRKRQALEANRGLYSKYGPYWLELAETYYDLEMFRECLNAAQEYEKVHAPIFRKDKDFARLIPKIIVAAYNVHGDGIIYRNLAAGYLRTLVDNTSDSDWALRYFAAQTYISLASGLTRARTLQSAYDLLINNVRVLSIEQEKVLNEYHSPVTVVPQSMLNALEEAQKKLSQAKIDKETAMSSKNTRLGKEQRDKLENEIKEAEKKVKEWEQKVLDYKTAREKELPPFSQALWVNYILLTGLFEPLEKTDKDIEYVHDIIDFAFWPLYVMESFWEESQTEDLSAIFQFNNRSISESKVLNFTKDFLRGFSLVPFAIDIFSPTYKWDRFFLLSPDVLFTEINSIDIKIQNQSGSVVFEAENIPWAVSAKSIRNGLEEIQVYISEIRLLLGNALILQKKEPYKMEIFIKNIDEAGSYNNRLHFEKAFGKTNWVFKYVE